MDRLATGDIEASLVEQLPAPLPADQIIALNQPKADLHSQRQYAWNGWTFDVPPGVFLPGATSQMIHERLLDGTITVHDRRYAVMGVGLGVETVIAGLHGAREIYAIDIHPASVETATRHYQRLVAGRHTTQFTPVVSDVFDAFPPGAQVDLITFNPPAVSQMVSDDPDVIRNVCVGTSMVARFFAQIADKDLLAPGGEVYLVVSNTADLRSIIRHAVKQGFFPEVHYAHDWHDGVVTYMFRLQHRVGA